MVAEKPQEKCKGTWKIGLIDIVSSDQLPVHQKSVARSAGVFIDGLAT